MEYEPKIAPYTTADKNSFGWPTGRERWPIIITQAIDDVFRTVSKCDDDSEKQQEGKAIVAEISKLKYEVQHDRQLTPIRDDGHPDVAVYNSELEVRHLPLTPWSGLGTTRLRQGS